MLKAFITIAAQVYREMLDVIHTVRNRRKEAPHQEHETSKQSKLSPLFDDDRIKR